MIKTMEKRRQTIEEYYASPKFIALDDYFTSKCRGLRSLLPAFLETWENAEQKYKVIKQAIRTALVRLASLHATKFKTSTVTKFQTEYKDFKKEVDEWFYSHRVDFQRGCSAIEIGVDMENYETKLASIFLREKTELLIPFCNSLPPSNCRRPMCKLTRRQEKQRRLFGLLPTKTVYLDSCEYNA